MNDYLTHLAETIVRDQVLREEAVIQKQLQYQLGYTIKVVLQRPWWMPARAYMRLIRTIVVEEYRA